MLIEVQYYGAVMPCCVTSMKTEIFENIRPYKNVSQAKKNEHSSTSSFVNVSFILKSKMFSPDALPPHPLNILL
jgi:hypothetical protein